MKAKRPIILWLISGCVLIFIMVIIGGITRLTNSGLSMSTWQLIGGTIPPLNPEEWIAAFNVYQATPEGKMNAHYVLDDFKYIFFWEYLHRMMGRLLGLVFIIPFIYFLIKKKLNRKLIYQSLILFSMGAMQAGIGWWMVKSGLVKNPDVSHFRLAIHLITAFLTCAFTLWVALPLILPKKRSGNKKLLKLTSWLFVLVIIQIIYGAFVAGLNAGRICNTWPKMEGEWIPGSIFSMNPFWQNFIENHYAIQFIHRTLAFIIVFFVLYIWNEGRKIKINYLQKKSFNILLSLVIFQIVIGIFTLILVVPISLALIHQLVAFLLLMSIIFSMFTFSKS
ncbi:MAG: COX15/CtaA family protein [Flavobacteriales bacterium]|nr:COX15/CtaA family protein [Flavobacteriales bacterium]|tara:strand:+ start:7933 stop:8940 length:1008 start_codon:yes stop_codon:yes gene_type:complete